jgi:N-acetylglucosamine-6-phosphate deacetylase
MSTIDPGPAVSSSAGPLVLAADRLITPDQVFQPGFVEIVGTRLGAVAAGKPPAGSTVRHLPPGSTLMPGLVDMHVHGAGGGNMTALDADELRRAAAALIAVGVTSTVASLVTAPLDELEAAVDLIAGVVDNPMQGVARIVGSHLEGPFLSPAHRGCHDQRSLRLPDAGQARNLLRAGRGTVRMLTLAPELPGARDVLRLLTTEGVVGAMGHTGATYDETREAISWGVRVGTHLFNGMLPPHHREPGPSLTLLDDPRVTVELINDGLHVHPAVARVVTRAAHDGRLALISDGVAATGAPEGNYMLGNVPIRSRNGQVLSADGTSLGGGVMTVDGALRRAVHVLGMSLELAVAAATTAPAQALGIADTAGSLAPGRNADICVMDADLKTVAVMLAGRWVVEPSPVTTAEHSSHPTT